MAITRSEFETARKMVQEAIIRHGDLRTALLTIKNKLELEAIHKSMKVIADYFVQTRKQTQQEQKQK
jgi:hypothetical protein